MTTAVSVTTVLATAAARDLLAEHADALADLVDGGLRDDGPGFDLSELGVDGRLGGEATRGFGVTSIEGCAGLLRLLASVAELERRVLRRRRLVRLRDRGLRRIQFGTDGLGRRAR